MAIQAELANLRAERDRLRREVAEKNEQLCYQDQLQKELAQARAQLQRRDEELAQTSAVLERSRKRARGARIYCIELQPHIGFWPCIGFRPRIGLRPRIYCIGLWARFWVLALYRASTPVLGFGPSSGFGPTFELRPCIGPRSCTYCFRALAQHLLLLGSSPAFTTFKF
ncbi:hypothetical protein CRG98_042835 [Punica granatum]|uniref:Uncharacterized protein n=1 Tax=Punica granatum TaxID=22663 RepID=A0A2I0HYI3_PUNGR|nr:hypothetical protein CRG98_042835 [Punica granatum]